MTNTQQTWIGPDLPGGDLSRSAQRKQFRATDTAHARALAQEYYGPSIRIHFWEDREMPNPPPAPTCRFWTVGSEERGGEKLTEVELYLKPRA